MLQDIITRYESLVKTHAQYVAAHQHEREAAQSALTRVEGMQSSIDYLQRLLVSLERYGTAALAATCPAATRSITSDHWIYDETES